MKIKLLIISMLVGITACARLPSNVSQPAMPNFTDIDFAEFYKNEIDRRTFSEVTKSARPSALDFLANRNIIEMLRARRLFWQAPS